MRVAVLDDYQDAARTAADWTPLGVADIQFINEHIEPAELVSRLAGFDVVVAMRERTAFPASVLESLPHLRLLVTTGMYNASIDLAAAAHAGITVCGTRGSPWSAAELAWGLILASMRNIPAEDAATHTGRWQVSVGRDLAGATLGLVGLGRLGARVAQYGLAFDMRVIAWSPHLTVERAAEHGVGAATREALFAESDVVSIHMMLADATRGLVSERELRAMKPTAHLVNTARGPIVDEAALLRALEEGWIAGAALDVFDTEPLPADHPLRRSPRAIVTPHIGYVTHDTYVRFYVDAVEDIRAFAEGSPVRRLEAR